MNNYNKTVICGEIKMPKPEYKTPKHAVVSQQSDEEYDRIEEEYFRSFEDRKA